MSGNNYDKIKNYNVKDNKNDSKKDNVSKTYIIESDTLIATISELGAELISVKSKLNHREYMWNGNCNVWKRHSPVLFPIVGKYKNDTSIYKGKMYHMTQHGFARDSKFKIISYTQNEVWFELSENEESTQKYPFRFKLCCGYSIVGDKLNVMWKVYNFNSEKMYFSLGAHPAFALYEANCDTIISDIVKNNPTEKPLNSMVGCKIHFSENIQKDNKVNNENGNNMYDEGNNISYKLLDEEGLLAPKEYILDLDKSNNLLVKNDTFDRDAYVIENNQCYKVSIVDNKGNEFVTVEFDAPVFGVWSPPSKDVPFICIEPWYGRCDSQEFAGELQDREWGNELEPNQIFERQYGITFNTQISN